MGTPMVNHTRFPKEDHLPIWARRDNQVKKGDNVHYVVMVCSYWELEYIAVVNYHRNTIFIVPVSHTRTDSNELPCSTLLPASNHTLFLTRVSVIQSKCVCVTKRKVMNTTRQSVHLISCPSTSYSLLFQIQNSNDYLWTAPVLHC